ncbi:peptidoglycan-binding domain-containing protein [Granulosicoccus antarcticus]|uniref:Peptidoglycan binding-like domain-containing protein n=1 Tax=Granulosicoccus antarcticus IMCC3135 TaxID=1192854 RepID=A0A2Z2P0J2_9GAMM|nr:peptidoglycan-binding domain-containing protein [Granulosicoccus antarcticus]ASJ75628.1 hypothetical protein IMCC3135_27875 [Granulosicoccus antarcticus IMCC3135]
MRKLTLSLLGVLGSCFVALPATAQQFDNSLTLPDAKPGECYAKVITPARFETSSEDLVVQEAAERIETDAASFEAVNQSVVVKEASQQITVTPTVFAREVEQLQVRAATLSWTTQVGGNSLPINPEAIAQLAASGIDTDAVEPDSCFVEYVTPAQYTAESEQVLIKEATQVIEIEPAVFETDEEQVLIKEASSVIVDVPAIFKAETESVMVEPARSVWKEDCGVIEQVANATGDVLCLVEVPARYEELTKTVLVKPATTQTVNVPAEYQTVQVQRLVSPAAEKMVDIPAEYTTITKQVLSAEARFFWLAKGEDADKSAIATGREICLTERPAEFVTVDREVVSEPAKSVISEIPAVSETIAVQRLATPATERRISMPEKTKSISRQVQIAPAQVEWKQVLCKVNMTEEIISSLQSALKTEGYDPGPADGIVGQGTLKAMEQYQTAEGIDRGGITLELLERLNIKL